MTKYIHNISGDVWEFNNKPIADAAYYEINPGELFLYQNSDMVLAALAGDSIRMSADGVSDYSTSAIANVQFLLDVYIQPADTVGSSIVTLNAYACKNYGTKKLYARNTGFQATLTAGSNSFSYTATYPWVKVVGIEVINAEALDTAELRVYDTPAGTYSGVPDYLLNQFGYTLNLPKDYYKRESKFDADLYVGMVLSFAYESLSDKTIGINIIMDEVKS